MDATHPPLCFCCAVLKELRPHNRRLSAGLLGEPHYHLREQEQVTSRERHRSSASPTDRDSHSTQKSGRTCCRQMSMRNFLYAYAWEKQLIICCIVSISFEHVCLHNSQISFCWLCTCLCVPFFQTSYHSLYVWLANACVCVCVRLTHAAEWVSDLWIMQSAHWRGPHVLCCGVLMRERLAGGRRDGLQSTLRMTAPAAGSQTINRACAESLDTWIRIRLQFPSVQLPPPPASLSCVLFSLGAASYVFSLSKVIFLSLLFTCHGSWIASPLSSSHFRSLISFFTSNQFNLNTSN